MPNTLSARFALRSGGGVRLQSTTPMPESLCDRCVALCCRYFALPLDNPTSPRDYDNIRWYLMHENVVVYIEKKQWYIAILTRCKNLQADNRCGVYETRPKICREYKTDNCDYHGGEYDFEKLFTSPEQIEAYAREKLKRRKRKTAVKRKPAAGGLTRLELPVVN
jgi:uncharacterized protein